MGVKNGDIIFSHVGMGFLGYPKEGKTLEDMFKVISSALLEALEPDGTLLVPTYSYSFCKGEPFDVQATPSTVGYFTERFRQLPQAKRSAEPIFSVAGIGPAVDKLFANLPSTCFGPDCLYDRLVKADASICNIGVGFRYATFVHYAEEACKVPYRFKKEFTGNIISNGVASPASFTYYARTGVDDATTFPDLRKLEKEARSRGYCKSQPVGKGEVTTISCRNLLQLCKEGIKKDPWYLAKGQKS